MRGFLSIDINVSELQVNQCDLSRQNDYPNFRNNKFSHHDEQFNQIEAFHGSHKCHVGSMQVECFFFLLCRKYFITKLFHIN